MEVAEQQIEYVHYPFTEEDDIFYVGRSIEISSTDYAKHGLNKFIFDLIRESFPVSDNVEVIEPIEIFETLQMADDGTTGDNVIVFCRIKIKMKYD